MEISLIAVAGNSCLAIISLIVFLTLFWLMKVRSLSYIWLESLALRLTLSLLISWRHFLMKNSKDANWPQLWGIPFRLSNRTCFESFFFPTSRLTENSSVFSEIGTEFMHLLRTDFSVSESGKFSGMATTVLRFAGDESLVV